MTDLATFYRVLARKYRPQTFAEVIGQEAMVRTLSNAIATGRIAHAFILTGVRGVGKTTTARIIARALNCIGPDGTGGPTVTPCGECVHCRSIAEDRHVDVIEMDAASRTGIDDIRDLTEGMRYRPVSARYKIYIIDEVHMLSKPAFNALLKTLEEPPPDVKFVFATTEVHRIPVTVLSRCQRFALRRVPIDQLIEHYRRIAEAEGITVAPAALGLIARAADGSVRDGLSLLDQAIALSGDAAIEEAAVRDMLGIADRNLVFDLFETVLKGDAAGALDRMDSLYQGGADPLMVLQDLLELSHFVTRLKLAPEAGAGDPFEDGLRVRAQPLAAALSMPVLARVWQILLKGLEEVQAAPAPAQATAMVLIRLAYAADLPVPADLVRALIAGGPASQPAVDRPAVHP
jgi:DNA polymerase-3 subunit gamma/tau